MKYPFNPVEIKSIFFMNLYDFEKQLFKINDLYRNKFFNISLSFFLQILIGFLFLYKQFYLNQIFQTLACFSKLYFDPIYMSVSSAKNSTAHL